MPIHLPPFPPFGFSVWYDRHKGRQWMWRERHPSGDTIRDRDAGLALTEGEGFASKTAACVAVREELARRRDRARAAPTE